MGGDEHGVFVRGLSVLRHWNCHFHVVFFSLFFSPPQCNTFSFSAKKRRRAKKGGTGVWDKTQRNSMIFNGSNPLPLLVMLLYFLTIVISWVNYIIFFRPKMDILGRELSVTHLTFCFIGTAVYISISSVAWLRAARYAKKTLEEVRLTFYGLLGMFFLKDLPLFTVDIITTMRFGWLSGYQEFCFVVQTCLFISALVAIWLTCIWFLTSLMESYWGNTDVYVLRHSEHGVVQPESSPPIMIQEFLHNRNMGPSFLMQANLSRLPSDHINFDKSKTPLGPRGNSGGYI